MSINKETFKYVLTCLQDSHETFEVLHLESQLQHEEIHQTNQYFELVYFQNNQQCTHLVAHIQVIDVTSK